MNKSIIILLAFSTVIGINYSCKKPKKVPVPEMVTGRWVMTKVAKDMNGNSVADANEVFADTSYNHFLLFFNSDGTGISTYYSDTDSHFSWSLENNNTYLKINDSLDISHIQITSLSSSSMTLKDTSGGNLVWELFVKQ